MHTHLFYHICLKYSISTPKALGYKPRAFPMRETRFELATFWSVARRSIQLSYSRTCPNILPKKPFYVKHAIFICAKTISNKQTTPDRAAHVSTSIIRECTLSVTTPSFWRIPSLLSSPSNIGIQTT